MPTDQPVFPTVQWSLMNPYAELLAEWFVAHGRDLPWRRSDVTPWGVLVSEVMLQQTPAARVIPAWESWMETWPEPEDCADALPGEVIRAWGRLGYPRRALRLHESARIIVEQYGGVVPDSDQTLKTLPGIGDYTAAAVVAFAYGGRSLVLDTNVRRVIARVHTGEALPTPHLTAGERCLGYELLPSDTKESVIWNQAAMELGALICRVKNPNCEKCPLSDLCQWRTAGYPTDLYAGQRKAQGYEGTHRQARGRILALLREAEGELVPIETLMVLPSTDLLLAEAIESLVADGLAVREDEALRLP
ncbi:MAG: A/G-specific adenine glycosylase [Propionibacteriaceae bacterium]|nr:A/G-specific adenine glycosylase [Propionibacteriaceae bacterium]